MLKNHNIIIYRRIKTNRYFFALAYADYDGELYYKDSIENIKGWFKTVDDARNCYLENQRFIKDEKREKDRDWYKIFDDTTYIDSATREEVESLYLD